MWGRALPCADLAKENIGYIHQFLNCRVCTFLGDLCWIEVPWLASLKSARGYFRQTKQENTKLMQVV